MAVITSLSQLEQGTYSYADYLSWKFDQALEIIRGKIFPMSGPSRMHQKISWKLTVAFYVHFKK